MNIWRSLGVFLILAAGVIHAQDADSQAFLKANPSACPKKVVLKAPVVFSLILNGKAIGSMTKPAQTEVDVVKFADPKLSLSSGNGIATIEAAQTDFWERVAEAKQKPATPVDAPVAAPAATEAAAPAATPAPLQTETPSSFEVSISPRDNFTKADFSLCLLSKKQVKGILVLVPGYNGDGRGAVNSPLWQNLARDFNLAIVGVFFQGGSYYQADKGAGDALLEALKDFAKESSHPELATAPLFLWGHSAGGQFNYDFVSWKPQRVAAFIVNKGRNYSGTPNGQSRKVPGLFILGLNDEAERVKNITDIYEKGRKLGALWALVPEPNTGHEEGRSPEMAEAFFRALMPMRISSDGRLTDIGDRMGYLAATEKKLIEPVSTSQLTKSQAGWLPNEASAKLWLSVVGGN